MASVTIYLQVQLKKLSTFSLIFLVQVCFVPVSLHKSTSISSSSIIGA